jgi:hypothetical protein
MIKFLDSKKIMGAKRITLSDDVCQKIGVQLGDAVFFMIDESGRVFLQKAEVSS